MRNEIKISNEQLSSVAMCDILTNDHDYIKVVVTNNNDSTDNPCVFIKLDGNIFFFSNLEGFDGAGMSLANARGFSYSYCCNHMSDKALTRVLNERTIGAYCTMRLSNDGRPLNIETYEFINKSYKCDNMYSGIRNYHSRRSYNDIKESEKSTDYRIGVELEVECNSEDIRSQIDRRFKSNWLFMERDGSLNSLGIEFITIPMRPKDIKTPAVWRNFIEFMASRAKSWDSPRCGLHVHIGRGILGKNPEEQSETIGKLLYLYHHYLKEHPLNIKVYGRSRGYEDHDGKVEAGNATKVLGSDVLKVKAVKDKLKNDITERNNRTRYFDVNLQNSATIEFRKGRGSLNSNRITAVVEYCELMCKYARKVKWERISADDFFKFAKKSIKPTSPLSRFISREENDC